MPLMACLKVASSSSCESLRCFMSAFCCVVDGGVEAPIVVHRLADTFTHRPRISCKAAGRFVSSLYQGAAHAGRCVWLVLQRAVGSFFHMGSVLAHLPCRYSE